ncbi:alanine--tRNA ligase [Candidatus Woesearchaeota archaeon]|nr:alanine--tRNA ligase [Candidatus Woesearchaeota archaeon]
MDRKELIKKYIEFYKSKKHKEIINFSLVPENDPTVLFTTAGMHPLVPFLLGEKHPLGNRLCNVQRCIRTGDIDEVGDSYHHTFFEMLGNWSLGGYFKKEAIEYSLEFLTKVLKIPIEKLAITCFKGDENAPRDEEAAKIWMSLNIPKERIIFLPKEDNWWGPAGLTGPCGPCTEIFYWKPKNKSTPKIFDPKDKNWVELGNNVLMEYTKDNKNNFIIAEQKNIDFGGGVERILTVLNKLEDNYLTDCWQPIIKEIEKTSKREYKTNEKAIRIIADHIKASVFIIGDGVTPSNIERGYVLRRLIRRAIRYGKILDMKNFTKKVAESVFEIYYEYKHLNKTKILEELEKEEKRFLETLENGIKEFEKLIKNRKELNGKDIFLLYQSYGFPFEMTKELTLEKNIRIDEEGYISELKKHQELSRTSSAGVFKSGLADHSEATTKLHTATHLLNAALKEILCDESIHQKGSNITSERTRFDFAFPRKLTNEEINKIEDFVNKIIKEKVPVVREEMSIEEAKKQRASGVFEHKYTSKVSIYIIGNYSKEICSGPHVNNTSELGHFKITKEEASSAGVRRIKAILE